MNNYVVTLRLSSGGGVQKVNIQARTMSDARKLAESQYSGATIMRVDRQ